MRKGGRPATGSIKWRNNPQTSVTHWHVRLTLNDGSRPFVPLDPSIPRDDEARARECARVVSDEARRLGFVPDTTGETVEHWFGRLHANKEARGLATVGEMRGRTRKWIFPRIGLKDMRAATREDIERIVSDLDTAVAAFMKHGPGKGRLSPSTAANVWGDLQHAFDEARNAKEPGLRVLTSSPAQDVRGPDAGDDRHGQILYSDEIVALLWGEAVDPGRLGVPRYRRIAYAMSIYLKTRASELRPSRPGTST